MDKSTQYNDCKNELYVNRLISEEKIEPDDIIIKTKIPHRFKEKYLTMFQGEFMERALSFKHIRDIFGPKAELLFYLINNTSSDNMVHLQQKTISEALNIHKANICKYLKEFESIGILKKKEGHIHMQSNFVYKGRVRNHSKSGPDIKKY